MTFNKEDYWKNRKEGKRGQGEIAKPTITESVTKHFIQIGARLIPPNRSTARKKSIDHKFTTKGHRETDAARQEAIRGRVKRTEAGEKQRVAAKKALQTN